MFFLLGAYCAATMICGANITDLIRQPSIGGAIFTILSPILIPPAFLFMLVVYP